MRCKIAHEIKGRIRFSCIPNSFTIEQADRITYFLEQNKGVSKVKVYERTGSIVLFSESLTNQEMIKLVVDFDLEKSEKKDLPVSFSGNKMNIYYKEKLITKVLFRMVSKLIIPKFIRIPFGLFKSSRYILKGLRCLRRGRIEVAVLDAAAITAAMVTGDFDTGASVMFLLSIGELLEEWTHKKSVDDLARSLSLNIEHVWLVKDETEVLVPISTIEEGDIIVARMGSIIPVDGTVYSGEATVNQASLTGESAAVRKVAGVSVYAGTVLEEGELQIITKGFAGQSRVDKIMHMIEQSEKLKSNVESKAEHTADSLVPYSFLGSLATYVFTRNIPKAISVLMVDFSCALKLSMPIAVLSAMRECSNYGVMVKGGKFLEAIAEADTIVFDKTGTLTKAEPKVAEVIPMKEYTRADMLRLAACLEEHFPHSIANAVVKQAERENLNHNEMHTKVDYIVAHGIASYVEDKRVLIGSAHFIFEDEKVILKDEDREKMKNLSEKYSLLYLAIAGELAAVICIEDPLRKEAKQVIKMLRQEGISKIVMLTGDSERTAKVVAKELGVDEYMSEVLPEDKAAYIERQKAAGRKVIMVGDGINDSPALSAANVGIAMSEGADIAREISDVTISSDNLSALIYARKISKALMKRIGTNYKIVVGFNTGLIGLGVAGVITPSISATLHNMSTLGVSVHSMTNLVEE